MSMVRGQFAQLLASGGHHNLVQFLDYQMRDTEYTRWMNVETSEQAFEDEVEYAGVGVMPEKPEGANIIFDDLIQGGSKRYLHLSYGLGSMASWELIGGDKYGVLKQA